MTMNQQSFLVSNMCGEFLLCGHCECGQTNPQQSCLWCEVLSHPWPNQPTGLDIYKLEASPFCVANPLQVNTELATEIVLRLSGPWCLLSEPFSMQDGKLCKMSWEDLFDFVPRGTSKSSPQCLVVQVSKCFKCFKNI